MQSLRPNGAHTEQMASRTGSQLSRSAQDVRKVGISSQATRSAKSAFLTGETSADSATGRRKNAKKYHSDGGAEDDPETGTTSVSQIGSEACSAHILMDKDLIQRASSYNLEELPVVSSSSFTFVSASASSTSPRTSMTVREVPPDEVCCDSMSADVAFMIKLKSVRGPGDDDDLSTLAPSEYSVLTDASAGTDTDTTLVDERNKELEERAADMEAEVRKLARNVNRLEMENKELMEVSMSSGKASDSQNERLELKQENRKLSMMQEDLLEEKKSLEQRIKALTKATQNKHTSVHVDRIVTDLRMRLSKAEGLVEDLQEDNADLRQEIKEMEEIQDSFCDDQAEEYHDLRKQLEQANKNGRIIQFKLRKTERVVEDLQQANTDLQCRLDESEECGSTISPDVEKLELELKLAEELSLKLSEEVDMMRKQSKGSEVQTHVRRQSSASEDSELLRTLQDTVEREVDMREQLRFAGEESQQMRRKLVGVEEENDSLTIQLKKMANQIMRQCSQEGGAAKDNGGMREESGELSHHELTIQLELNERETSTLRRKVDKMEQGNEALQLQISDLQSKASSSSTETFPTFNSDGPNSYYEQKINVLEEEMNRLRKKVIEKQRNNDILITEREAWHRTGAKAHFTRARSLELPESAFLGRKQQPQLSQQNAKHESVEELVAERLREIEDKHKEEQSEWLKTKASDTDAASRITIRDLESKLVDERQECEDLVNKYELLEEEHAVSKAQFLMEKDQLEGEFTLLKHEYDTSQSDLQTLRDTYNSKQDQWLREKLALEEKVKESEKRWGRAEETYWKLEKSRLQRALHSKAEEVQKLEKAAISHRRDMNAVKSEMERQLESERRAHARKEKEAECSTEQEAAVQNKKIDELQQDLLELRNVHAKLRETNRRVLRERDGAQRECLDLLTTLQQRQLTERDHETKVVAMVQQVERMKRLIPAVTAGSKISNQREKDREELSNIVANLVVTMAHLSTASQGADDNKSRCPSGRQQKSYRRSASAGTTPAETEKGAGTSGYWGYRSPYPVPPGASHLTAGLHRKSASVDESQDSVYQCGEGSEESLGPFRCRTLPRTKLHSDISIDRISTESTQSEIISGAPPVKEKSALKALKSWARSRSTEGSKLEARPDPAPTKTPPDDLPGSATVLCRSADSGTSDPAHRLRQRITKLFKPAPPRTPQKTDKASLESSVPKCEEETMGTVMSSTEASNRAPVGAPDVSEVNGRSHRASPSSVAVTTRPQVIASSNVAAVTTRPQVTTSSSAVVATRSQVTTPSSVVFTTRPQVTTPSNVAVNTRPQVTTSSSVAFTTRSQATTPSSVAVSTRPLVTPTSSVAVSTRPLVTPTSSTAIPPRPPKIVVSPVPKRTSLVLTSFSRARARFES